MPADSAGVFAGSLNQHNQTERGARLREGARHVTGDSNAARETPDAGLPGPRRGGAASRGRAGPSRRARGGDKRLSWASAAAAEPASWRLGPFCSSLPAASPGLPASADVVELAAADIVAGRPRLTPNATFTPRMVQSACPSEPKRSCRKAVGRRLPGARGGSRTWPEAAGEGAAAAPARGAWPPPSADSARLCAARARAPSRVGSRPRGLPAAWAPSRVGSRPHGFPAAWVGRRPAGPFHRRGSRGAPRPAPPRWPPRSGSLWSRLRSSLPRTRPRTPPFPLS